jgi:hypothetical protein
MGGFRDVNQTINKYKDDDEKQQIDESNKQKMYVDDFSMTFFDGRWPAYLSEAKVGLKRDGRKICPSHFRRRKAWIHI